MHIEVLVEDSSGERLLAQLLPKILGEWGALHTWKLIAYKGVGHIPKGLTAKADPSKRILLDQLPRLLRGYGKTPGIDAVVVVLDTDRRDCKAFLHEWAEKIGPFMSLHQNASPSFGKFRDGLLRMIAQE